jgi:hypothetical protein
VDLREFFKQFIVQKSVFNIYSKKIRNHDGTIHAIQFTPKDHKLVQIKDENVIFEDFSFSRLRLGRNSPIFTSPSANY